MTSGDAGSTLMNDCISGPTTQERLKLGTQLVRRMKTTVRGHIGLPEAIQRSGDMSGNRV
jgi:hypothetical protein